MDNKEYFDMKKEYIIFNQRLAGFLMMNGFVLKRLEKSTKQNSDRNIFFFNESDDLFKKITEFKETYQ
jgi:hypothetical protein